MQEKYPYALEIGTRLHDDTYEIIRVLGQGGFGITYEAKNLFLDRRVALKEFFMGDSCGRGEDGKTVIVPLKNLVGQFETQRGKFIGEAKKMAKLRNKHIVTVYAFFNENDTSYIEMDYVEGQSLYDWLNLNQQPLDEGTVRFVVLKQMLEALECIHNQDPPLCHLDIKPENIMVDMKDYNIVLIDFGASKFASNKGGMMSSMVAYSPGYAPLEQAMRDVENMGPWTDFYSLGATMFTMLTGYEPFPPSEILSDPSPTKENTIPLPPDLSDQMKQLILWMMAPNRAERPQSVQEIREFLDGPQSSSTPSPYETQPQPQPMSPEEMFNNGEECYYGRNGNPQDYSKAVEWYRKAAEQDYADAQNSLGFMFLNGKGVEQSDTEAVEWFRKAANQGYAAGQYNLGLMYQNGLGVDKDFTQAANWFLMAANQGYADAQDSYGSLCQDGEGVAKNEKEAVAWFAKAANQGNANAQNNLGYMYRNGRGGLAKSDANAAEWYRKAAAQGHSGAQNNLAFMYHYGFGVKRNMKEALKLYEKSANQGNTSAMFNLALISMNEFGDPQKALGLFEKAAQNDHTGAQYYLGKLYQSGQGVTKNLSKAFQWYAKAAEKGYVGAQYELALMWKDGQGTDKNEIEAVKWLKKAAGQGYDKAQCELGKMYLYGMDKDVKEAKKWLEQAAGQGNVEARKILSRPPFVLEAKKKAYLVFEGRKYELMKRDVTVGRRADSSKADIQIEDPSNYMSRHHADLTLTYVDNQPRVTVKSVNERNLVMVNGLKLPVGEEKVLNNHDRLTMADKTMMLLIE